MRAGARAAPARADVPAARGGEAQGWGGGGRRGARERDHPLRRHRQLHEHVVHGERPTPSGSTSSSNDDDDDDTNTITTTIATTQ